MKLRVFVIPALLILPGGCIASAVGAVVTAPVKIVSKGVDLATTSQSEADENRGRAMRKSEERLGKLSRERDKAMRRCDDGNRNACDEARDLQEQIDDARGRVM
ncbi:hypothetical protein [Blastomonas sp.]|uniref:hypothetical protein n=1 Tax=Blastomonas sp. TaxID=1909299 RepID=UPI0035936DCF